MSANPEWLARGTSEIFPDNPDDNLAKAIAKHFRREFDCLYTNAYSEILCFIPQKESQPND